MKAIYWTIAAASFACAELVHAGINDPEVIIYRGAGVVDTGGGDFSGNATAFHCTNFSGVNENIRFVLRNSNGGLLANTAFTVPHLNTGTVVTKQTGLFAHNSNLNTGVVQQGTVAIAATSINVTCTAMLVQASTNNPEGIRLHMTRFNPIPATQE